MASLAAIILCISSISPCLDPLFEERNRHKYSLMPELYGRFLCNLFDLWHNDFIREKPVFVRSF